MHKTILQQYAEAIQNAGYATSVAGLFEDRPPQGLAIQLDPELTLTMYFLSDLFQSAPEMFGEMPAPGGEQPPDFLQLFIRLPIEVSEPSFADLSRLVLRINWSTAVGAFGLNETQKMLCLRHVLEVAGEEPDPALVAATVAGMHYYARQSMEILAQVASGALSLEALLARLDASQTSTEVFPGYDYRR